MGTVSVQKRWRKACGAIKDSATVGIAKVNSGGGRERKDLDVAVVKATTHVERPPKERHVAGETTCPLALFSPAIDGSSENLTGRLSLQRSSPPRPPPARSPTSPTASMRSPSASPRRVTGWYVRHCQPLFLPRSI